MQRPPAAKNGTLFDFLLQHTAPPRGFVSSLNGPLRLIHTSCVWRVRLWQTVAFLQRYQILYFSAPHSSDSPTRVKCMLCERTFSRYTSFRTSLQRVQTRSDRSPARLPDRQPVGRRLVEVGDHQTSLRPQLEVAGGHQEPISWNFFSA